LTEYLDIGDYLLITETVLGVPAERVAGWSGVGGAESALNAPAAALGGVEFYPDVIDKAAVTRASLQLLVAGESGRTAQPPFDSFSNS
jgi:hypothetical protein